MAKPLKSNGSESEPGTSAADHNVANINNVIRECASKMIQIKKERGGLNERAGDIRERLTKAGVQTKAFDFAIKLQDMEQEARESYLESLRLNFDALGVGMQGDIFAPMADETEQSAAV